jgi:hypothetical protein
MRVNIFATLLLAGLGVGGATPLLSAQALGDVARKEEERRKDIKAPAKVYTNKDLGAVPPGPATPPPAAADASKPAAPAAPGKDAKAPDADKDKDKGPVKDQAYWSGRKKELQGQLDRDQTYLDALQSRINALTADFTARADPAQRAVIERDRQKAIAEQDRLKKSVQNSKKAITDLDEEARRAGVPPGWLR